VLRPTTCFGRALDAFRQALAELGHREDQNVDLLYREAEGQLQRLPTLARELVDWKVDVLFSSWGTAAPLALKQASATIPIVAGAVGDPVAAGLGDSLAKPGGNVTGFSTLALTLEAKRLELLREIEPHLARIAVLWDPDNPYSALALRELERTAGPLGIRLIAVRVAKAQDLDPAFAAIAAEPPDALLVPAYLVLVPAYLVLVAERERIVAFAAERRLPTVYSQEEFVEVGGLASYGIDLPRLTARAAVYVDKMMPPTLLARADEVIK
jgi:putative ABC transport system substrate-binding protein